MDRQKEFDDKNSLGFPLLSDSDRSVSKLFGVKRMGPLPSKRATFVIDKERRLVRSIRSETNMLTHADEALEALRAL